jgi:hypothetical protein
MQHDGRRDAGNERPLRTRAARLLAAAALACTAAAQAQNTVSLRQQTIVSNVQQCQQLLLKTPQLDPYAPKDDTARATYCDCVGRAYTNNTPDATLLAFRAGKPQERPGDAARRVNAAAARLDAARVQCVKPKK